MTNRDEFLSKLLKQKIERPSEGEWRDFDRSLANKILANVHPHLLSQLKVLFSRNFKVCCGTPLACLLLFVFGNIFQKISQEDAYNASQKFSEEYVEFATDRIMSREDPLEFAVSDMMYSYDGVEYISDAISVERSADLFTR